MTRVFVAAAAMIGAVLCVVSATLWKRGDQRSSGYDFAGRMYLLAAVLGFLGLFVAVRGVHVQ